MPTPREEETKDEFIERCMGDDEAVSDYPDREQRFAVCNSLWDEGQDTDTKASVQEGKKEMTKVIKTDDGLVYASGIFELDEKAKWTTAYINDLPDSAFLYIKPGGEKDDEGKTKPRDLRMFPYKNAEGSIDLPHLRNALARIPQASISNELKEKLTAKARRILERETGGKSANPTEFSKPIPISEFKTANGDWEVSGYVSIFGNVDMGHDIVKAGAFQKSLESGRKVRFLRNHDYDKILGVPVELREDSKGLFGRFKISKTRLGEETRQLLQDGALDSFSFGFNAADWEYKENDIRELKSVDLYEASLVSIPMNEQAIVTGYKSLTQRAQNIGELLETFLADLRGLVDGIDRPLTETKRQELEKLLELCSGMDAVRSDLQKVLVHSPVKIVEAHRVHSRLAELRKEIMEG